MWLHKISHLCLKLLKFSYVEFSYLELILQVDFGHANPKTVITRGTAFNFTR